MTTDERTPRRRLARMIETAKPHLDARKSTIVLLRAIAPSNQTMAAEIQRLARLVERDAEGLEEILDDAQEAVLDENAKRIYLALHALEEWAAQMAEVDNA